MTTTLSTQVLIIGAGPSGLAMAIELGQRGVPCLVIERHSRVGHAPRAKTANVRSREHMRRWGIADKLREASPLGANYPSNIVFVTRLAGYELARFENALYCTPGRNPLYAEHSQWIPQYTVEEVMRKHAATLPSVKLAFDHELTDFEQDNEGVTARLRDIRSGEPVIVRSAYLVGADGARSRVREIIGARMSGDYGLSRNYNLVFRAPGLAQAHRHIPAMMYWHINADVPSYLGPLDRDDRWFFVPTAVPRDLKLEGSMGADLIARTTGIDLPYEILSTDEWVASRLLADRYSARRAYLIGDACHLHPPFGGYGMNMGISDGVDLGWKMAAVLQGWGGAELLHSYELERKPVHRLILNEAVSNHGTLGNQLHCPGIEDADANGEAIRREVGRRIEATKLREFDTLGVMRGYHYGGSPFVVADGTPEPAHDYLNYVPSARPGAIAPHGWLYDGSSLYDHFGSGFTLLVIEAADDNEARRFAEAARHMGVPLKMLEASSLADFPALPALYQARYVLIRPDQHVAWRGARLPDDPQHLLRVVTGHAA
jgi:2-polyprenyl-6-methoxyphenol hydroxylase-like FAD-dependent oxidoreductase